MSIQEPFYSAMVRVGTALNAHPRHTIEYDMQLPSEPGALERLQEIARVLELEDGFRITTPLRPVRNDTGQDSLKANPVMHIAIQDEVEDAIKRESADYRTRLTPPQQDLIHKVYTRVLQNNKNSLYIRGIFPDMAEDQHIQMEKDFATLAKYYPHHEDVFKLQDGRYTIPYDIVDTLKQTAAIYHAKMEQATPAGQPGTGLMVITNTTPIQPSSPHPATPTSVEQAQETPAKSLPYLHMMYLDNKGSRSGRGLASTDSAYYYTHCPRKYFNEFQELVRHTKPNLTMHDNVATGQVAFSALHQSLMDMHISHEHKDINGIIESQQPTPFVLDDSQDGRAYYMSALTYQEPHIQKVFQRFQEATNQQGVLCMVQHAKSWNILINERFRDLFVGMMGEVITPETPKPTVDASAIEPRGNVILLRPAVPSQSQAER